MAVFGHLQKFSYHKFDFNLLIAFRTALKIKIVLQGEQIHMEVEQHCPDLFPTHISRDLLPKKQILSM